jgi:hypothetical protein
VGNLLLDHPPKAVSSELPRPRRSQLSQKKREKNLRCPRNRFRRLGEPRLRVFPGKRESESQKSPTVTSEAGVGGEPRIVKKITQGVDAVDSWGRNQECAAWYSGATSRSRALGRDRERGRSVAQLPVACPPTRKRVFLGTCGRGGSRVSGSALPDLLGEDGTCRVT